MHDSRREILGLLWGKLELSSAWALLKIIICLVIALLVAFIPLYPGLEEAARWTFFILLFAAGLWISEAIPAFAVALLIIALEIAILGNPRLGIFAKGPKDWEMFIHTWSSPLIWLFFGGFILAAAASKTGLDRWFATHILTLFGKRSSMVLLGMMVITFCFSMFVSNTATTVMMMAVVAPVVKKLDDDNPFGKAILLAIPFSANVGGMGTIIGSPPNAIAVGALGESSIDFLTWMKAGLPPAIILAGVLWIFLIKVYPSKEKEIDINLLLETQTSSTLLPVWKKLLVMIVFFTTLGLWLTSSLHHIPTPVISFIPISIFVVARVIEVEDIRSLSWDILLLLAGGLSLGVAVSQTGLAEWMASLLPSGGALGKLGIAFAFSYLATTLSNFMSNTAASNILVPIGLAAATGFGTPVVVSIALGASAAMCLPISTPPNAVAYGTGNLSTRDFLAGGILMGILAPILVVLWCSYLFN